MFRFSHFSQSLCPACAVCLFQLLVTQGSMQWTHVYAFFSSAFRSKKWKVCVCPTNKTNENEQCKWIETSVNDSSKSWHGFEWIAWMDQWLTSISQQTLAFPPGSNSTAAVSKEGSWKSTAALVPSPACKKTTSWAICPQVHKSTSFRAYNASILLKFFVYDFFRHQTAPQVKKVEARWGK